MMPLEFFSRHFVVALRFIPMARAFCNLAAQQVIRKQHERNRT